MTASTNQMKKQSYQDGFNESIKQIEFLQNEVMSCKTIYAASNTKIMELESVNKKLIEQNKIIQDDKSRIEKENIKIKDLVRF